MPVSPDCNSRTEPTLTCNCRRFSARPPAVARGGGRLWPASAGGRRVRTSKIANALDARFPLDRGPGLRNSGEDAAAIAAFKTLHAHVEIPSPPLPTRATERWELLFPLGARFHGGIDAMVFACCGLRLTVDAVCICRLGPWSSAR